MVTSSNSDRIEINDFIEDSEHFERIRSSREGAMPVSRTSSAVRGRRRSRPSKRTHSRPQHCRSTHHRRRRKWL